MYSLRGLDSLMLYFRPFPAFLKINISNAIDSGCAYRFECSCVVVILCSITNFCTADITEKQERQVYRTLKTAGDQ